MGKGEFEIEEGFLIYHLEHSKKHQDLLHQLNRINNNNILGRALFLFKKSESKQMKLFY